MDILLNADGDLHISGSGDIAIGNSIVQKVRIKLLWFAGEWKWDKDEGMPYLDELLVKNPNTDYFESLIRQKIFEIDEITEVKDVSVSYDRKQRSARVRFVAMTDQETIMDEFELGVTMDREVI